MYNQQIVKRVSDGDLKAFRKMYVDCAPAVYDCAYDILHDVVRSNMVVARTFVDIFNYLPQLKKLRLFDEWVYRLSVYHADNIALEDFIRGSEKLETIWRDIIRELGVNDPMRKRPMVGRGEEPERPRPPIDVEHDKRMRAIEKEAEAIHQDRAMFAGFSPPTAEPAKSVSSAHSNRAEPLIQREVASPVSSFKPAAPPMPEEEWTPILFPSEGEEVRYDRTESATGALRGVRKTVLMPASKAFALKRTATGDFPQDNFYREAIPSESIPKEVDQLVKSPEHEPVEWTDPNPYAFWDSPAQADENGYDTEESLLSNQEEETPDSEFAGRYEEELSSIPRLNNFQDEQLERFRALLDETRTSEKASEPPPPEPRDDLDLAALVRGIKDRQDDEEEHEEKQSDEPKRRPKKRKKRRGVFHTILVVVLTLVIVVILPLILMAYHIFATPAFLRGAVLMTTYVLQNIFSFGAQVMTYFKSLS